jgi:hypothetical protein
VNEPSDAVTALATTAPVASLAATGSPGTGSGAPDVPPLRGSGPGPRITRPCTATSAGLPGLGGTVTDGRAGIVRVVPVVATVVEDEPGAEMIGDALTVPVAGMEVVDCAGVVWVVRLAGFEPDDPQALKMAIPTDSAKSLTAFEA